MAAPGPWQIPDLAHLNFFNATDLLNATAANFRIALVSSAFTPNLATDELWAAASGSEIANGQGYTTGGLVPPSIALSQTAGVVKFTASPTIWTATGTGIPAWRRAVLYYLGTLNGKANPLAAYFLGDSAPADIPLTTAGNTLTITANALGFISSDAN